MQFYTYIHTRADDGQVFYVGKGTARDNRAESKKGRSDFWKRTVAKHGLTVDICMRFDSEEDAFTHERFLIQCFRDLGAPLANLTDGGEGPCGMRHSAKTRELLSVIQKGRKRTPEQVAATARGNTGQRRTPEQRAKLTAAQLGRVCKPETREKLRMHNLGHKAPPEVGAKISAALRGKPKSAEHIAKVAEALRISRQTRDCSAAAHKAWATKRAKKAADEQANGQ